MGLISRLPLSVSVMIDHMANGVPFSFSRFGDGEWYSILRDRSLDHNCDGHPYCVDMEDDFEKLMQDDYHYYHGLLSVSLRVFGGRLKEYVDAKNVKFPWYNGDALLDESVSGDLLPFVEQWRKKKTIYVGPDHLTDFLPHLGTKMTVTIPQVNAYVLKDVLERKLYSLVFKGGYDAIGFSAGFVTKLIINDLFPLIGDRVTMIDFGSQFDGYVNRRSRSYHRHHDWYKLKQSNFGEVK